MAKKSFYIFNIVNKVYVNWNTFEALIGAFGFQENSILEGLEHSSKLHYFRNQESLQNYDWVS